MKPARLRPRERLGVGLSVAGLAVLGVSLAGGAGAGTQASWPALGLLWLAGSVAAATAAATAVIGAGRPLLGSGAAFGVATGVAFAAGDVATKATVSGDLALAP